MKAAPAPAPGPRAPSEPRPGALASRVGEGCGLASRIVERCGLAALLLGGLLAAGCTASGQAARTPSGGDGGGGGQSAPGSVEERVAQCNRLAREVRTWCRTASGEYRTVSRRECLSARLRLERSCF